MCPWNNGRWYMEISEGNGSIRKTDKIFEIYIGKSDHSMILFGQISATMAARMGIIDVKKNVLTRYDRLFKTDYIPFCCDII